MGLDIYCRWGSVDEDGCIIDGMTPEEQEAQITGFYSAPDVGYLRYNWSGVSFVGDTAATLDMQSPIAALYPDWQGSNGESLSVDALQLARLAEARAALERWLNDGMGDLDMAVGEPEHRAYYAEKVRDTIAFIDFVLAHQDRPGLRIEFD